MINEVEANGYYRANSLNPSAHAQTPQTLTVAVDENLNSGSVVPSVREW